MVFRNAKGHISENGRCTGTFQHGTGTGTTCPAGKTERRQGGLSETVTPPSAAAEIFLWFCVIITNKMLNFAFD